MKLTTELYCLVLVALATSVMWMPHILESFWRRGLLATMGNPSPDDPAPPAWADRTKRAHANAVANLAVFAAVVLTAAHLSLASATTAFAAETYLVARLAHYVAFVAGIPVLRTIVFLVGWAATVVIGLVCIGATN
jgi:uncharacterized MAPEG superfamily protein